MEISLAFSILDVLILGRRRILFLRNFTSIASLIVCRCGSLVQLNIIELNLSNVRVGHHSIPILNFNNGLLTLDILRPIVYIHSGLDVLRGYSIVPLLLRCLELLLVQLLSHLDLLHAALGARNHHGTRIHDCVLVVYLVYETADVYRVLEGLGLLLAGQGRLGVLVVLLALGTRRVVSVGLRS